MYLIPEPKKIIKKNSTFNLPYNGKIAIMSSCETVVYEYAKLLKNEIYDNSGISYGILKSNIEAIIIISEDKSLKNENYVLDITNERIEISGGSHYAVLYGIQTLRQLIKQYGLALPCLTIEDYPEIKNRGFYHDATRGRVPKLETLKTMVDTLSYYKINQLQLYIEHSYLFSELSEVWRDDTPLTAEEIMELDKYCNTRGVELIPSISTFGHLYKLLRTKQYKYLCECEEEDGTKFGFINRMHHHTINITDDQAIKVVENLLNEFMPLFTSKKFNICADETFDLGKGKSLKKANEIGVTKIYVDFLNKIVDIVAKKGLIPMFWGDVILVEPELIKELPENIICLNWGYSKDETEDATKTFAELGANQYVCPGVAGWNHLINLQYAAYENISKMCRYGHKNNAIGVLNTDWGDYGHINHPLFSNVGMIYGAEFSWNKETLTYEKINKRISLMEYGDSSESIVNIIGKLSEQVSFGWNDLIYWKEYFENNKFDEAKERVLGNEKLILSHKDKIMEISNCKNNLANSIRFIDSKNRKMIQSYLIAAEGIKIFNLIGEVILRYVHNTEIVGAKNLAKELEEWYHEYKSLWRTISKESELYRITEVICWYADFLRDL